MTSFSQINQLRFSGFDNKFLLNLTDSFKNYQPKVWLQIEGDNQGQSGIIDNTFQFV
jgi:hypothetical protein